MPNLSELLIYTGETPLAIILWSIFIGVFVAAIASFVIKVKFGAFMQALLKNDASSPEKAMTLADTGIKAGFFVKMGLRSHASYKNLMVAITDDGKFYANAAYTDDPPTLKTFSFRQTKTRRSRVKEYGDEKTYTGTTEKSSALTESAVESVENAAESVSESISETATDNAETAASEAQPATYQASKQRVKFDILKARYYVPPELHDRAASLYFVKPTKFIALIGLLIALGVVVAFSENIIIGLTDFMNSFIEGL